MPLATPPEPSGSRARQKGPAFARATCLRRARPARTKGQGRTHARRASRWLPPARRARFMGADRPQSSVAALECMARSPQAAGAACRSVGAAARTLAPGHHRAGTPARRAEGLGPRARSAQFDPCATSGQWSETASSARAARRLGRPRCGRRRPAPPCAPAPRPRLRRRPARCGPGPAGCGSPGRRRLRSCSSSSRASSRCALAAHAPAGSTAASQVALSSSRREVAGTPSLTSRQRLRMRTPGSWGSLARARLRTPACGGFGVLVREVAVEVAQQHERVGLRGLRLDPRLQRRDHGRAARGSWARRRPAARARAPCARVSMGETQEDFRCSVSTSTLRPSPGAG
jgi:hypothetical protein